jgi:hypothetical protein
MAMNIRFPHKRNDGSFDVLLKLTGVHADRTGVTTWLQEWGARNRSWERRWAGATTTTEVLQLDEALFSPPTIEELSDAGLTVRLRIRPDSKLWKDWMAKFVMEFCTAHPGFVLKTVESAL